MTHTLQFVAINSGCEYKLDSLPLLIQAYTELRAYAATEVAQSASADEKELVRRLIMLVQQEGELQPRVPPLTVESALAAEAPSLDTDRMIPLTW